jgi:hypothetical protein
VSDEAHSTADRHADCRARIDSGGVGRPAAKQAAQREKALKRLRKLLTKAADEIDRLIGFLDKTDDYVSRELEDTADDNPCDDLEIEPSLGWTDEEGKRASYSSPSDVDSELDDSDDEPSLGSIESYPAGAYLTYAVSVGWDDQSRFWASGNCDDREGDEHDGAEPDVDDEPSLANTPQEDAFGMMQSGTDLEDDAGDCREIENEHADGGRADGTVDDEPSLGWPERMVQGVGHGDCNDHELTEA